MLPYLQPEHQSLIVIVMIFMINIWQLIHLFICLLIHPRRWGFCMSLWDFTSACQHWTVVLEDNIKELIGKSREGQCEFPSRHKGWPRELNGGKKKQRETWGQISLQTWDAGDPQPCSSLQAGWMDQSTPSIPHKTHRLNPGSLACADHSKVSHKGVTKCLISQSQFMSFLKIVLFLNFLF